MATPMVKRGGGESGQRRRETRQDQRHDRGDGAEPRGAPGPEPRRQSAGGDGGQDGAAGEAEEGEADLAVGEGEPCLDGRQRRRPAAGEEAEFEEDREDGGALGPADVGAKRAGQAGHR